MEYEINKSGHVPTCLPKGLDTSNFIDVTCIGDNWAQFMNPETGEYHNCEKYYEQAMKHNEP